MKEYLTVSSLNEYISILLENDTLLSSFWIKGEMSGVKLYQQSGHLYFNLKDENATVNCVMFKSRVRNLDFKPEDGIEILAKGYVSVFAKQGRYQVYIEEIQPYGQGGLFLYLEQLKKKLAEKGYFNESNKKKIPEFATKIGIVTSQDSAALSDILKVLNERNNRLSIIIVHSSVQGNDAPFELANGINLLNEYEDIDVIIIGRGGGSLEDLMAFNSEEVVKAVYESMIPIISAVGHETDFSLCDLAADLRAATPTQAAQFAVPDLNLSKAELANYNQRMKRIIQKRILYNTERLDRIMIKKVWSKPEVLIQLRKNKLVDTKKALIKNILASQKEKNNKLYNLTTRLDNLSPLKVLNRGYSIVMKDNHVVTNIDLVDYNDELKIMVQNGKINVIVKDKEYGLDDKNRI